MSEYLTRIKTCCDLLGSVGHSISDDDQISYILNGLGRDYDSVVVAIGAKPGQWTAMEVHSLLHTFEARIEGSRSIGFSSDSSQPSLNYVGMPNQPRRGGSVGNRGRRRFSNNRGARGNFSRGGMNHGRGRSTFNSWWHHLSDMLHCRTQCESMLVQI